METKILKADMRVAASLIAGGGLVAVPTETVYGLAANGLDSAAVARIYEAKGRPEVKPLALMVPDTASMTLFCKDIPPAAQALAERFWPGPLSIVLRAKPVVPEIVRAGGETVSLRCPDHPLTLEALRLSGLPFAAPSANPSGQPSPKTAGDVLQYFDGKIDAVIDGGPCDFGRESTIVDMSATPYRILRQGALSEREIADALVDNLRLIGITGGTGCGKTTALQLLRERGALIIDCDAVYHELLERDEAMLRELDERFPGAVVDGKLQRKTLGAVVFQDGEALKALNAITHRHIGVAVQEKLRAYAMAGGTLAAFDAIELISSGLGDRCDFTVGIVADTEKRIERIMARDGISREYALLRVQAQRPNEYFREHCSFVLENNGARAEFEKKFNELLEENL